jgi:HK97 gp10 family phage protein
VNFSADFSQLAKLAEDMVGAGVQSDLNLEHATDKVAEKIAVEQRNTAPVLTGALRDSISIEHVGKAEVRVGPTVPYARFVEDGTANMAPQPFIRPAAAKFKDEYAHEVVSGPFWKR